MSGKGQGKKAQEKSQTDNPISPERLATLRSYHKAKEIEKHSKDVLLPCMQKAKIIIKRAEKAFKIVNNHTVRLEQDESPKTSENYKRSSKYLSSNSPGEPMFLLEGTSVKEKLENAMRHYAALHQEFMLLRHLERASMVEASFQRQNDFFSTLMNTEGSYNKAFDILQNLSDVIDKIYMPPGGHRLLALSQTSQACMTNGFKIQHLEEQCALRQADALREEETRKQIAAKKEEELRQLKEKALKRLEEADDLALREVKATMLAVNSVVAEDLLAKTLDALHEKVHQSEKQIKEFNSSKNAGRLLKIMTAFRKVFNLGESLPAEIKDLHYLYLKVLFELNRDYYFAVSSSLNGLRLSEIGQFVAVWSQLEKVYESRVIRAKAYLAELYIQDVALLTKLLVPVHRAVLRFKKEYLEPLINLAFISKQRQLIGQLEAAQIKLEQMCSEAAISNLTFNFPKLKDIVTYKEQLIRLGKIENSVHHLEALIKLETEINQNVILPMGSINSQMMEHQRMLEQRKAGAAARPSLAELFAVENFISSKLSLLRDANALEIVGRLFSSSAYVTYLEFQNMLRVLREESTSSEPVKNHSFFQFPQLWQGLKEVPQVLISIPHRADAPAQEKIQDPNVVGQLRKACVDAGMSPELLSRVVEAFKPPSCRQS